MLAGGETGKDFQLNVCSRPFIHCHVGATPIQILQYECICTSTPYNVMHLSIDFLYSSSLKYDPLTMYGGVTG